MSGKGIGIPVKLMHESEGHTITVRNDLSLMHPSKFPVCLPLTMNGLLEE